MKMLEKLNAMRAYGGEIQTHGLDDETVLRFAQLDERLGTAVPFTETRGYLRRVLAADVIFHWRLTGETRRLAAIMPPVPTNID